MLKNSTQ